MNEAADKPHEATPRKLDKAREKGEVARSADLNTFALYLGTLGGFVVMGPVAARMLVDRGGALLAGGMDISMTTAGQQALWSTVVGGLLLTAVPAGAVAAAIALQRSAVLAPTRLAPKLSRISPISGAKNKFGASGLFEFAKSAAKMALYGGMLGGVLLASADDIAATAALSAAQGGALLARLSLVALAIVVAISTCLAAIDFVWQRHTHASKNRMSRQELQDEMKESDGDPQLKARRRQRAEEIAANKMLGEVPDATVVIVNPTHYAVALKWSATDPTPPVCVAKGVDEIATRIRESADAADVPIFSDPPTARALHATVDLKAPIPREHFQAVAAAIRFAEALRREVNAS